MEAEHDGEPWYSDIKNFFKTGRFLEHANIRQKRTIRRLANGFFSSGDVLFKQTVDLYSLRCLDAEEAEKIMNEVHAGVCGPHMNGYVLAKKILRAGYYWLTMERDCFHFVKKCHQCQISISMSNPWRSHSFTSFRVAPHGCSLALCCMGNGCNRTN